MLLTGGTRSLMPRSGRVGPARRDSIALRPKLLRWRGRVNYSASAGIVYPSSPSALANSNLLATLVMLGYFFRSHRVALREFLAAGR